MPQDDEIVISGAGLEIMICKSANPLRPPHYYEHWECVVLGSHWGSTYRTNDRALFFSKKEAIDAAKDRIAEQAAESSKIEVKTARIFVEALVDEK